VQQGVEKHVNMGQIFLINYISQTQKEKLKTNKLQAAIMRLDAARRSDWPPVSQRGPSTG